MCEFIFIFSLKFRPPHVFTEESKFLCIAIFTEIFLRKFLYNFFFEIACPKSDIYY
jgi:hypothetical protein